ncbi:MAG TPA: porin [Tabrizicola sp.]|jgi:outer membrane protein OmpU|nr:porin [Tabrizicola sp.]
MKTLLTSTALLLASVSFASAEITLSGSARMGVIDDFGDDNTGFTSRARVEFSLSGETDGGLSFGASFRADNASGANSGTAGSVFVSGAFGKLSMGDVDGAANAAVGHVDGVGLTGLGDLNESTFLANGGNDLDADGDITGSNEVEDPSALYTYSAGDLNLYISSTKRPTTLISPMRWASSTRSATCRCPRPMNTTTTRTARRPTSTSTLSA